MIDPRQRLRELEPLAQPPECIGCGEPTAGRVVVVDMIGAGLDLGLCLDCREPAMRAGLVDHRGLVRLADALAVRALVRPGRWRQRTSAARRASTRPA